MNEVTTAATLDSKVEQVLIQGDLAKLSPLERVTYYNAVCASLRLNPLTKPFDYLTLNGKLVLYARRDCTEQLRKRDGVSITAVTATRIEDVYVVTATASAQDGRTDTSTGVVPIKGLSGDNLANALMKAETKAKRRVTLSLCGLGLLDETELETIPKTKDARSLKEKLTARMEQGEEPCHLPTPNEEPTPLMDGIITAEWPPLSREQSQIGQSLQAAFPGAEVTFQPPAKTYDEPQYPLQPGPACTATMKDGVEIVPDGFPVGKHKNQPMDTIPAAYLKWASENMSNQMAKRMAVAELSRRADTEAA